MRTKVLTLLYIIAKYVLKSILMTCKIEYKGLDKVRLEIKNRGLSIYIWHEKLILLPFLTGFLRSFPSRTIMPVLSGSQDGNLLNNTVLKNIKAVDSCIRVHSNARHHALRAISKALKTKKALIVTPDGPSGPLHKIKPGALFASRLTNTPIFLMSWKSSKCWRIPSWDRMQIPLPFSKIKIILEGPFEIEKGSNLDERGEVLSKLLIDLEPKLVKAS